MKMGFRTPNVSKSLSARTTGRIKRAAKSSINPIYSKKGIGVVHDPEKAMYNAVYNKATVGVNDIISDGSEAPPPDVPPSSPDVYNDDSGDKPPRKPIYKRFWFWLLVIGFAIAVGLTNTEKDKTEVAEASPTVAPTEAPTEAPTPTIAPTPEPTPEKALKKKAKPTKKPKKKAIYVYVAASGGGSCYHSDPYCSRMNGNVRKLKLKKAKKHYKACSRCTIWL